MRRFVATLLISLVCVGSVCAQWSSKGIRPVGSPSEGEVMVWGSSKYKATNGGGAISNNVSVVGVLGAYITYDGTNWVSIPTSDMFYDKATGNVGIGTNAPAKILDVYGAAGSILRGDGGANPILSMSLKNNDPYIAFITSSTYTGSANEGGVMKLYDSNSSSVEKVRIDARSNITTYFNAGNFGIGTNAPGTDLHVADASANAEVRLTRSGTFPADYTILAGGDSVPRLIFKDEAGGDNELTLRDGEVGIGSDAINPAGKLTVDTSSATYGDTACSLRQDDVDESFIDFVGTSAADVTKNISTLGIDQDSTAGTVAAPDHANWDCKGLIKIEIGGTDYWIPAYQPN